MPEGPVAASSRPHRKAPHSRTSPRRGSKSEANNDEGRLVLQR